MTNAIANKDQLFASLKDIQWESEIPADFSCIGNIEDVYPDYETNAYRTFIWENPDGIRIATWDLGNTHLAFMCDGSLEGFIAHEKALDEEQSRIIAVPGSLVHFAKNPELDHLPEIYDWTFTVKASTREGITLAEFDFVFPHGSYRVSGALETANLMPANVTAGDPPAIGDTVIYVEDGAFIPSDNIFQLGQGYTVTGIEKAGIRVDGQPDLMFHFEYTVM